MLLLFPVRVAECPPFWERAVHSVLLCESFMNVYQFMCTSLRFGSDCGICGLIVLVPDRCFTLFCTKNKYFLVSWNRWYHCAYSGSVSEQVLLKSKPKGVGSIATFHSST